MKNKALFAIFLSFCIFMQNQGILKVCREKSFND